MFSNHVMAIARDVPELRIGVDQGLSRIAFWQWPRALQNGAVALASNVAKLRTGNCKGRCGITFWRLPVTLPNGAIAVARYVPEFCAFAVTSNCLELRFGCGKWRVRMAQCRKQGRSLIVPWR